MGLFGNPDHYYGPHSGHRQGVSNKFSIKKVVISFGLLTLIEFVFLDSHIFWDDIDDCILLSENLFYEYDFEATLFPWPDAGVLLYSAAIAPPDGTWWPKLELETRKVGRSPYQSGTAYKGN